jgi:hypothetical protein
VTQLMRLSVPLVLIAAFSTAVSDTSATAQGQSAQPQSSEPVVAITIPRAGSSVGREVVVKGTAKVPDGTALWLLTRRADYEPLWWPQRAVRVDAKTGEWSGTATIGVAADVGSDFDIAVITVDASAHQQIQEHWTRAMTSGDWKPMRIPDTTSPPRVVKVRKTSDR